MESWIVCLSASDLQLSINGVFRKPLAPDGSGWRQGSNAHAARDRRELTGVLWEQPNNHLVNLERGKENKKELLLLTKTFCYQAIKCINASEADYLQFCEL